MRLDGASLAQIFEFSLEDGEQSSKGFITGEG